MSDLRPMSRFDRFCAGGLPFELITGLGTAAFGTITGFDELAKTPPEKVNAYICFTAAAICFVAVAWRAIARNLKAQPTVEVHSLDGVLHALHGILTHGTNQAGVDGALRICIHVPGKTPETVHQITNYVGVEKPYGRGRDIPSRCGIVGKAIRHASALYDKLPKDKHLTDHLVNNYGYSRPEAGEVKSDRKAWAALPVATTNVVVAIIYADSDSPNAFGGGKRKILEGAILGVAKFIADA
jgi:hypothetical protein